MYICSVKFRPMIRFPHLTAITVAVSEASLGTAFAPGIAPTPRPGPARAHPQIRALLPLERFRQQTSRKMTRPPESDSNFFRFPVMDPLNAQVHPVATDIEAPKPRLGGRCGSGFPLATRAVRRLAWHRMDREALRRANGCAESFLRPPEDYWGCVNGRGPTAVVTTGGRRTLFLRADSASCFPRQSGDRSGVAFNYRF
jgi:hypothetical protein